MECLQRLEARRLVLVGVEDLGRALSRISEHGFAATTLHEPKRWGLGERDAIGQPVGRRVRPKTPRVKRPQRLQFIAHVVGACNFVRVGTIAHGTARELVSGGSHCARSRSIPRAGTPDPSNGASCASPSDSVRSHASTYGLCATSQRRSHALSFRPTSSGGHVFKRLPTWLFAVLLSATISDRVAAQACLAMPALASHPVNLGIGAQFADGAKSYGARLGFGSPTMFGGVSAALNDYDDLDEGSTTLGFDGGLSFPVGVSRRAAMCPIA